jgi:hypothetical protein
LINFDKQAFGGPVSDFNFQQLKAAILPLSNARDWDVARKEWRLVSVMQSDELEHCPCGHPIMELCTIANSTTGHAIDVGNVCVNRFLGIETKKIFEALRRIRKDSAKSINADAAAFFHKHRVIGDWEYGFIQSTHRKRTLTSKQISSRKSINEKILAAVRRRGVQ